MTGAARPLARKDLDEAKAAHAGPGMLVYFLSDRMEATVDGLEAAQQFLAAVWPLLNMLASTREQCLLGGVSESFCLESLTKAVKHFQAESSALYAKAMGDELPK